MQYYALLCGVIIMEKPFEIGDRVTTKYHSGEEDIIRTITWCEWDDSYGSGYGASADGGDPCKCCKTIKGKDVKGVDSAWFVNAT